MDVGGNRVGRRRRPWPLKALLELETVLVEKTTPVDKLEK